MSFAWLRRDPPTESVKDPLLTELHAEIADHLAEMETDLKRKGESSGDVSAHALSQFGNVERVVRQCRWEHQRELIVLRWASVGLLAILAVSIAAFAISYLQLQRSVAALGDESPSVQIRGSVYLGNRDNPASGAKVFIYENSPSHGLKKVRTVVADAEGGFRAAGLLLGDYLALAPLVDEQGNQTPTGHGIQNKPLSLVEVNAVEYIEFDLLAESKLTVSLSGDARDTAVVNGREERIGFAFSFRGPDYRLPWSPDVPLPPGEQWPITGSFGEKFRDATPAGKGYKPSRLPVTFSVPPGPSRVIVYLVGAEDVFGDFIASTMLEVDIPKGGETELRVQLPEGLDDLRHIDGPWRPLMLNAETLPVEQHTAHTQGAN